MKRISILMILLLGLIFTISSCRAHKPCPGVSAEKAATEKPANKNV